MQETMIWKLDLRLFDDGGAGAAGGAEGGAEGQAEGVKQELPSPVNQRRKADKYANVIFGKVEDAHPAEAAPAAEPTEEEWKAAKEKYRSFYERDTSSFVQDRLKSSKQAEANLAKLAPILQDLGQKYGKDAGDIDGILAARASDDSLYEEEAAKEGVPVEIYKQLKSFRDEKAAQEAQAQRDAFDQHIQGLITSFESDVKTLFPNADLRTEMQNPMFQRLTSPDIGMSVKDAYFAIHSSEIQAQSMQVATQKAQEKLSQSVRSNARRPSENGMKSTTQAREVRSDPRQWSKDEMAEVRRRVMSGERIVL